MEERREFVSQKEELQAKIACLESMNSEFVGQDFDVGQLENEVENIKKLLQESRNNEAKLRNELIERSSCKYNQDSYFHVIFVTRYHNVIS